MRHQIPAFAADQPMADINTTPMIDVLLVLMIMLMLSLPMPTHKLPVDLPGGSNAGTPPVTHRLMLDAQGRASWDGVLIGDGELAARLTAMAIDPGKPVLQMQSDAATPYVRFEEALAAVRRAGISQIGFVGNEAFRGL
jgi:biopolymer transport protein ExbD